MRSRRLVGLRTQLVAVILLAVLPGLLYSAAVLVHAQRGAREAIDRSLLDTTRALALALDRELDRALTATRVLATSGALRRGDLRRFYDTALEARAVHGSWQSVFVTDERGQELLSLVRPFGAALPNLGADPDIRAALDTRRPVVSGLRRGQVSGRWVIRVVIPVVDKGVARYALATTLSPSAFDGILAERQGPRGGATLVLDRDGLVVWSTADPARWIGQPAPGEMVNRLRGREGLYRGAGLDGTPVHAAFARAPAWGFAAVLSVPAAAVTVDASRSLGLLIGGGLVFVVGAVVVAAVLADRLTRPVRALTAAVTALGNDRPLPAMAPTPTAEFAGVEDALRRAAAGLEQRRREEQARLAAEHERHEAQVRERQLARIQRITDIALRNAEPDELLRQLVDAVRVALDADTATVLLLDEDTRTLRPAASTGLRAGVQETVAVPLDRGAAGAIAASEAGLAIDDLDRVEVVSRFLREQVKSLLGAPIRVEGRLLGVLHVGTAAARRFTDEDLALLRLVAERVGLALERTRLLAAERSARAEAEALAGVASEIGASLDLQRVLERVGRAARELCEADVVRIALREPDTPTMTYRHLDGTQATGYDQMRLEPGRGFVGQVLRTGRPYRTADALNDPAVHPEYGRRLIEAEGVRTVLVVPIPGEEQLDGLIYVARRSARPFTDREETALGRLASHAALALRNARLYRREQAARRQAEEASRGKDEFLAMLGHELRNPLSAIGTAVEVLQRLGSPDEAAARAHAVIGRQVHHLAHLVDDLLDVARVTTGKIALARRRVDLAAIAERTVATLGDAGRTRQHQVRLETAPVWIDADETRIEQIVGNLVTNAAKFTPAGGRITVTVGSEGDAAVLRVTDTGVGIPATLLPRIFEAFVQGERTLDRAQGGLGLGLTLVRRLVELHGGTVEAASEGPGRGAAFTVRLPRGEPPRPGPGVAGSGAGGGPARRVLVVEDNADARDVLVDLLRLQGHEVHAAADGASALAQAAALRPDVAIVDLGLPDLDGHELARRLRGGPAGQAMHLVALTGFAQPDDEQRALQAGFDAYLVKPPDPTRLQDVMAARGRRAPSRLGDVVG